jgi:hypothetical protein
MTLVAEPPRRTGRRQGWRGPQYPGDVPTLGWVVLDWITDNLPSPADPSQAFVLTDEQARLVLRWYELDPDTGDFVYRRGRSERAKGWGKSPLLAAIALAEFAGPVCFGGWDRDGEPIGVPWTRPVVEIAAVSEDQTDNTYAVLYEMLTANEGRAAKRLGIDTGRTRLYLTDRHGDLRPVTASSASREGARLTFAVLDETHLWLPSNGGVRLAGTLRRNAAKMGGRTFETTNAPVIGEKSVAEASGLDAEPGVLHDVVRPDEEPSPDWSDERMRAALVKVYGDSYWANPDRLIREIRDPATPWDDALRFWFNIRTAGVARAVDPRVWDALARSIEVPLGTPIGIGFDGSEQHDATVLRGCTPWGHTFVLGYWQRPKGATDWRVPTSEVDQAVGEAFARYRVGRMLCDPPRWQTNIERWAELYGEDVVLAFDTNQPTRMAPAVDRWLTAIRAAGALLREREGLPGPVLLPYSHDGDAFTADQVKACRLRKVNLTAAIDDRTRYMLEKDGRVGNDAAVADVLAFEAAMTMPPPAAAPTPFVLRGTR